MKRAVPGFTSEHPGNSREYQREYQRARRMTAEGRQKLVASNLKRMHGITLEQYDALYQGQRGLCALCRKSMVRAYTLESTGKRGPKRRSANIDHDPACCPGRTSCGRCIRGLLCSQCNTGIGQLRHSVELMRLAIEYLTRPRIDLPEAIDPARISL